jgi:hypothetical protein
VSFSYQKKVSWLDPGRLVGLVPATIWQLASMQQMQQMTAVSLDDSPVTYINLLIKILTIISYKNELMKKDKHILFYSPCAVF